MIGIVIKRNMVARWCDALSLGVHAGLDLPKAVELACNAMASPSLKRDGQRLIAHLESGGALDAMAGGGSVIPAAVPAAISLGSEQHDLVTTLDSLGEMYQRQAELRLGAVRALFGPILIVLLGSMIFVVIIARLLPMFSWF